MRGSCCIFLYTGKRALAIPPFNQIYRQLNLSTDRHTLGTTDPLFPTGHKLNQQKEPQIQARNLGIF